MSDNNEWTWWQDALSGRHMPIDVNDPQTGYYRTRGRGGRYMPVAFWRDGAGSLRCRVDNLDVLPERAVELWPFASKNPVSFEDYTARIETGKWPGEHEAVINHNQAPPENSVEAIAERIEDLAREAAKLIETGAAQSESVADQASDLANTLGELETKADKLRVAEKEPHIAAGRAVDGKWNPLRDKAAEFKRRLKLVVITPFLTRKRDEAMKANVAAVATGVAPETLPQQRVTAGSSKRATALRTHVSAEVENWDALLAHLKEHPEIREAAQRIANASAKAGFALPGTRIVKTQVAA